MHKVELVAIDSYIFECKINGEFIKYIKSSDISQLSIDICSFLNNEGYSGSNPIIKDNQPSEFDLDIQDGSLDRLINLILIGNDREIISLPENLRVSIEKNSVIYSHRSLANFYKYWDTNDSIDELKYSLFQQLSDDIIQIPYVDAPKDYEYRFGKVAYHVNHGTTHAIRSVELFNRYYKLIQLYQFDCPNHVYPFTPVVLTKEERNCLELAMFLFRSGRTNELGWSEDDSYSLRSAAIFSHIATKLGYNEDLVHIVSLCFDYKKEFNQEGPLRDPLMDNDKSFLYQSLFRLSHCSDLVRCNTSYHHLAEEMQEILLKLMPGLERKFDLNMAEIISHYLALAASFCELTGAMIAVPELKTGPLKWYFGSPNRVIRHTYNIAASFSSLALCKDLLDENKSFEVTHLSEELLSQSQDIPLSSSSYSNNIIPHHSTLNSYQMFSNSKEIPNEDMSRERIRNSQRRFG